MMHNYSQDLRKFEQRPIESDHRFKQVKNVSSVGSLTYDRMKCLVAQFRFRQVIRMRIHPGGLLLDVY